MSRRSLSARISPDIDLNEIRIKLARFGQPTIELHGAVAGLKDRRVEAASSVTITTLHLTVEGERFIEAMRDAFSTTHTATRDKATT